MTPRALSLLGFALTAVATAVAVVLTEHPARAAVYASYLIQTSVLSAWALYLTADWRRNGHEQGRVAWLLQAALISTLFYVLSALLFPFAIAAHRAFYIELRTEAYDYPITMLSYLGPNVAASLLLIQLVRLLIAVRQSRTGEPAWTLVTRHTELPSILVLALLGLVAAGSLPELTKRGLIADPIKFPSGWHLMLAYFGYWLLHDAWRVWRSWRAPPSAAA